MAGRMAQGRRKGPSRFGLFCFSDTVHHLFGASVVITGHNFQQTHNNEMAEAVTKDFGRIDIFVHSLANGPEVTKPLLETSRRGYLATISASSYSFVSLLRHFLPIMNPGGASISLTYIASERAIPGYEGGMSSANAALESDTKVLAFELHLLAIKHQFLRC
ncbi:enoyl-[acyl-carrier-protein] reductase [NADH] 1, chloroplastic-like [Zingiber officinale]|uniref:enoyl-[acyl-carrier-protein] reductase [NADH] 1, chloroplastic-like n=1 Tax=Zingiber officinale TaxID=94328 RepID=UPI001C4C7BCB|nr:enoyl-[acyl-carrier-protein] reductase [NADH] 1, chloroplastic-like [Zingiber officinale]